MSFVILEVLVVIVVVFTLEGGVERERWEGVCIEIKIMIGVVGTVDSQFNCPTNINKE